MGWGEWEWKEGESGEAEEWREGVEGGGWSLSGCGGRVWER